MITALDVFDSLLSNSAFYSYPRHVAASPKWEKKKQGDSLLVDIDMPGVSIENIEITQEDDNTIVILAKRGEKSTIKLFYTVDEGYDVSSLAPTLQLGVLTLKFNKLPERQPKKFKILSA